MRENRLSEMEEYIREKKTVTLEELCNQFNISINTVRRDIAEILQRTDIKKIYGGVAAPYNKIPPAFSERSGVNLDAKKQIGYCAAQLVNDGDIIYVDSGTTTCHMIEFLSSKQNVTVITHSLDVINKAVLFPNLTLICLSGTFNKKTFSFTGQSTLSDIADLNISKAFMAANGVTIQNGATQSTPIEFAIKKEVVSRSDSVYVMIENKKFGSVSLFTYCHANQIDAIITEKMPTDEFTEEFAKCGGRIILA